MNISKVDTDYWLKKYPDLKIIRDIKSGKEATVVLIQVGNELRCLKIYNRLSMATKGENIYLAGKHFRRSSEKRATEKGNKFGKDLLKKLWIKREFYLLSKLFKAGVTVPKVFDYNQNSMMMEYFGDSSTPAPLIKDVALTKEQATVALDQLTSSIKTFYQRGIVHGDLSEFNILWWQDKPYIIDFPQAIDIRTNPNYMTLLERDIANVVKFFEKWFLIDEEKVKTEIISKNGNGLVSTN